MASTAPLTEPDDIRSHARTLVDLQRPINVQFGSGLNVPDCHLIFSPTDQDSLCVRLPSGQIPDHDTIQIDYSLHGVPFQFACEYQNLSVQNGICLLSIPMPSIIHSVNRRIYIRTKFPHTDPIGFDFAIAKNSNVRFLAEDLSAGGIGFFVPDNLNRISLGCEYPVRIHLPDGEEICTQVTIRNMRQFSAMHRIGCRFVCLDAKKRMKLLELVTKNEALKYLPESAPDGDEKKAYILVIDNNVQRRLWPLLDEKYLVHRNDPKSVVEMQHHENPELLILNFDSKDAIQTLKSVRNCASFRTLPLILASSEYTAPPIKTAGVHFARYGMNETELVALIDRLVYEYRWLQEVSRLNAGYKPPPKVLLLDKHCALDKDFIGELENRPYDIGIINDDRNLICRLSEIDPDVILFMHTEDDKNNTSVYKLINFNKKLRPKHKILITPNKALAKDLRIQRFIDRALPFPVETRVLVQTIDSLI